MRTIPTPEFGQRGACAEPEHLALVDAAFDRPGGPAAQQMQTTLCARCPIASACAAWAMEHREHGVWGGMSPNLRTRRGGPPAKVA